ncbi:MAG: permease, partial [Desulfobulbaceae bacterium]|nr:permease [Desulfobulbaceae bacterium]
PVGFWNAVHRIHWPIAAGLLIVLGVILKSWFSKEEMIQWGESTWGFAVQILPLLFAGVLAAGFLLGRPGHDGIIPTQYIETLVGGNSIRANFFASIAGAFMYFATLTEVPILEGLLGSGMGQGPALALLLAGPALSLPNMLVIRSVIGTQKTLVFVGIVIVLSTIAGIVFGGIL